MKNVQIDFDLFCDLYRYFYDLDCKSALASDIWIRIENKMDHVVARDLFSKYKRAATREEQEAARKAYLKFKGIDIP